MLVGLPPVAPAAAAAAGGGGGMEVAAAAAAVAAAPPGGVDFMGRDPFDVTTLDFSNVPLPPMNTAFHQQTPQARIFVALQILTNSYVPRASTYYVRGKK